MTTFETLAPVKYDANLAQIAELKEKYMPLKITDLDDKEQFDAVHAGRMVMVKVRTTIDKQRQSNNESANKYVKDNNAKAKELVEAAAPIEAHLSGEEKKVTDEEKRIKAEEEEAQKVLIQNRVDALAEYKLMLPFFDVASMTDEEFDIKLAGAKEIHEAELKQLEEDRIVREAEEARIIAERAENTRIREEQEAKAKALQEKEDALKAKEKALEDEKKAEQERKNRESFEKQAEEKALENSRGNMLDAIGVDVPVGVLGTMSDQKWGDLYEKHHKEWEAKAKEKAERDAKEKGEREAKEKREAEEAEKVEAERKKALLPDKAKLVAWAELIEAIVAPEVKDAEAKVIVENAGLALSSVAEHIISKSEVM